MDITVQKLKVARDAAAAKIRDAESEIARIDAALETIGMYDAAVISPVVSAAPTAIVPASKPPTQVIGHLSVPAAVTLVLKEAGGGPMLTEEIMRRIEALGVKVGGSKPMVNLSNALSGKRTMFKNEGRYVGWRLLQPSDDGLDFTK